MAKYSITHEELLAEAKRLLATEKSEDSFRAWRLVRSQLFCKLLTHYAETTVNAKLAAVATALGFVKPSPAKIAIAERRDAVAAMAATAAHDVMFSQGMAPSKTLVAQVGKFLNALEAGTMTTAQLRAYRAPVPVIEEKVSPEHSVELPGNPPVPMPAKTQDRTPDARYLPQLLNTITEGEVEYVLRRAEGDHWCAQREYDGKRIILHKSDAGVCAPQREGKECTIAPEIMEYAKTLPGSFIMDGVAIGPDYYAFDLLERDGVDLRPLAYGSRYKSLLKITGGANGWPIHPAPLYTGEKAIRKFMTKLKAENAEGIVFKDMLAPYTAGRPNSGGTQLKCKFVATCSAIVLQHIAQRSVALALYLDGSTTDGMCIGNVTIPANYDVPPVGAVCEVKYLYWFKGGALYQPQYQGVRDDVPAADCSFGRQNLKVKAENAVNQ
jgi:bifunctional non-homologous end joining protein LigD